MLRLFFALCLLSTQLLLPQKCVKSVLNVLSRLKSVQSHCRDDEDGHFGLSSCRTLYCTPCLALEHSVCHKPTSVLVNVLRLLPCGQTKPCNESPTNLPKDETFAVRLKFRNLRFRKKFERVGPVLESFYFRIFLKIVKKGAKRANI